LRSALSNSERHGGNQVAVVGASGHVQIIDVDAVEQSVVANLGNRAGSVDKGLHVEESSRTVGEAILVLVGQSRQ